MNIMEELIIIAGISLDIFAVMECQGSLLAKIEKKQLFLSCIILMMGQAVALAIGEGLSMLIYKNRFSNYEIFIGQVIAAVIFLCMGIRLLLKAWKNESIIERRKEKFYVWEFIRLYARISIFTLFTGLAFGFLESSMAVILIIIMVMTVLVTVLGMYTGYRLGFEHKVKAYLAGGILLTAAGVDVIVRYICNVV